jgi:ATP-binding cassette subfamily B (MDR/TAP) protein 1
VVFNELNKLINMDKDESNKSKQQKVIMTDKPSQKEEAKGNDATPVVVHSVGYFALFKYTDTVEKVVLFFGMFLSIANGATMPLFSLIFGNLTSDFTADKSPQERREAALKSTLTMFYLGLASLVAATLADFCWNIVSQRLNIRVRKLYLAGILGQEMGWFDKENPEKLTTRYVEDITKFQGAIGNMNYTLLNSIGTSVAGFIVGFTKGWWFSLIVFMSFPLTMLGMLFFLFSMQKEQVMSKKSYEEAGAVSEQCFGAIKTVKLLTGEEHETNLYSTFLDSAKRIGTKYGTIAGVCFGIFYMCIFITYGLNFWLGAVLIDKEVWNSNEKRDYNVADILTVFFSVVTGCMALGGTSPALKAISMGKQAAYEIYEIIERKSLIPINDTKAKVANDLNGEIEFDNVTFSYPSRPDKTILSNFSMKIPKGKKVALVGETGCGKSTTVQLLERNYDPSSGRILIDGVDIKDYNLNSLRNHIGYVGQEPVLFAMSIRDNLLLAKPTATEAEMIEALKQANAYSFVMKLEKRLETYVGAGGNQISGGQKQRISIARSILQNPKILLLDEATSALDRRNEREIQATLDKFSSSRTTITIAHRLSTIINADIIYVIKKGQVVEMGSHNELLKLRGNYFNLISVQLDGMAPEDLVLGKRNSSQHPELDRRESNQHMGLAQDKEIQEPEGDFEDVSPNIVKELTPADVRKKKEEETKQAKEASKKMRMFLKGNYTLLIFGCLAALACGCQMPIFALFMADMLTVLSKFSVYKFYGFSNDSVQWQDLRKDALWIGFEFIILALVALVVNALQIAIFNRLGHIITARIRKALFKQFITRDIPFFDEPKNNPGVLSAVLAKDCLTVNTVVSSSYGAVISAFGSLVCGLVIAFVASWRLALVTLSVSPLIILSGSVKASMRANRMIGSDEKLQGEESKTFQETCTNMRTVNSLNAHSRLQKRFENFVEKENEARLWKAAIESLLFGFSQFCTIGIYALSFYAGAEFTVKYGLDFQDMFRALFAIIFAAVGAAMAQTFAGNIGDAQLAAKRIMDFLNIENKMPVPANPVTAPIKGFIEFRNVAFTYPQRNQPCFKDVSFKVDPMQRVAFAGPSGSGKSTIFWLLSRLYDVDKGEILVDGVNVKDYDLTHLRKSLGMVTQEPVLFNSTIRYNIKYNMPEKTDEEMIEAARIANALKFIESDGVEEGHHLPTSAEDTANDGKGFDRKVGLKGSKLSGGQKQRVAIARTVIRKPAIYMFDEATSALDTESEKIVQQALHRVSTENTTLSIAHRVSTIKDSDVIFVIDNGAIAEQGKFDELMQKRGTFYSINRQM